MRNFSIFPLILIAGYLFFGVVLYTNADDFVLLRDSINDIRKHESSVAFDPQLANFAQIYAQEILQRGYLSHYNQDDDSLLERSRKYGIQGYRVGEILGFGKSLDEVFKAWLKSPSHKAILEKKGWNLWGFGQAQAENGIIYVVVFSNGILQSWVVEDSLLRIQLNELVEAQNLYLFFHDRLVQGLKKGDGFLFDLRFIPLHEEIEMGIMEKGVFYPHDIIQIDP